MSVASLSHDLYWFAMPKNNASNHDRLRRNAVSRSASHRFRAAGALDVATGQPTTAADKVVQTPQGCDFRPLCSAESQLNVIYGDGQEGCIQSIERRHSRMQPLRSATSAGPKVAALNRSLVPHPPAGGYL
jgi:hypothetical protein